MGELFFSDIDPAAEGSACEPGEWPDDLTEGSECCSASGSCCEAVAGKKKAGDDSLDIIPMCQNLMRNFVHIFFP